VDQIPTLLPVDDDVDTGGFFAAARRGRLALRRCNGCDAVLHVPRMYCRHCGSWDGRWSEIDGAATLHSWTVVTHQVHPAYPVPYTLILIDLDAAPGTHLLGRIDGAPELAAGMPLDIWFEELGTADDGDGGRRAVVLPNWRLRRAVTSLSAIGDVLVGVRHDVSNE
jgi:hypothetical protein